MGDKVSTTDANPMVSHSKVLLCAPRIPKTANEGGVGVLPSAVITELLQCLVIQAGYMKSIVTHVKCIFRDMKRHNSKNMIIVRQVLHATTSSSYACISFFDEPSIHRHIGEHKHTNNRRYDYFLVVFVPAFSNSIREINMLRNAGEAQQYSTQCLT